MYCQTSWVPVLSASVGRQYSRAEQLNILLPSLFIERLAVNSFLVYSTFSYVGKKKCVIPLKVALFKSSSPALAKHVPSSPEQQKRTKNYLTIFQCNPRKGWVNKRSDQLKIIYVTWFFCLSSINSITNPAKFNPCQCSSTEENWIRRGSKEIKHHVRVQLCWTNH